MLIGNANVEDLVTVIPEMSDLKTGRLRFEDVVILQGLFEIRGANAREGLLPPALHPTNPPYVTFVFWKVGESEAGPFTLAQLRIGCRSGTRPRGFLTTSYIDNPDAGELLASRRGFNPTVADVQLQRGYDAVTGAVRTGQGAILELVGGDPDPLAPNDIQFSNNMNLARTEAGLRLLQVEPHLDVKRAERVTPRIDAFDAEQWGESTLDPYYPVSGAFVVADIELPALRFMCKTDEMAFTGTEPIR